MRKILGAAIAVLMLAAVPATANAATLTVTKKTTTADTTTNFGFHVEFTPFPNDNPGPFKFPPTDFSLMNGTSKTFSDLHKGFFTVTENVPAGWKLDSIACTKDPDPADAPVITGNKVRVELSPDENKTCVFTNSPVSTSSPPAEQPSGSTSPSPSAPAAPPQSGAAPTGTAPTAAPPAPQSAVSPERVVSARAALQAPRQCVSRRYTVTVTGGPVRSVTFSVNGRAVRTVTARPQQRRFSLQLGVRSAVDRVVARVRFRSNASPRTRTLRATVRRCAQAGVSPEFTG